MTDNNKTNQHDQNSRKWSDTRTDHYTNTGKVIESDAEKKNQGKQNPQNKRDDQQNKRDDQYDQDVTKNNYSSKERDYSSDQNSQRK